MSGTTVEELTDFDPKANRRPVVAVPRSMVRRFWVPLLLLIILAGLTAGGLNGSSSAAIRGWLGSSVSAAPELIAGTPLEVRADEWAINTPLSILQVRTGMPRIQPLIGHGADMALAYDVPVADRWAFLQPQHWGFMALPLDQGFAFHWWFPALLLVFAMWLLTVTLMPGRNTLGLLIGVAAMFSPFMQWWNLAGSFLPEAFGVLACALFVRILRARSRRWLIGYAITLTWLLACFARLLYPPFQIPCMLVAGFFCVGYLVHAARDLGWRSALARVGVVAGCAAFAGVILGLFLLDHRTAVQAIANSLYPGNRTVTTGGYSISRLFSGFLDRRLIVEAAAKSIDVNQSEASSPLLAGLLTVPILLWLLIAGIRRRQRPNAVVVALLAVLLLFLVHLFVPHADLLANLTLLDRVPANRLLLGMGMLSDVLLVAVAWQTSRMLRLRRSLVVTAFAVPAVALAGLAVYLHADHAIFVGRLWVAVALAVVLAAAVAAFATRRPALGAAVLVVVSFLIAGMVNPLSAGVSTTDKLPIAIAMAQIDQDDPGGWIVDVGRPGVGVGSEASLHLYNPVYNYPQLDLWRQLDPTGEHSASYNRYGWPAFHLRRGPTQFQDPLLDHFDIGIDGCAPFVQSNIKHIAHVGPADAGCLRLRETTQSGSLLFYLYDIIPPGENANLGR